MSWPVQFPCHALITIKDNFSYSGAVFWNSLPSAYQEIKKTVSKCQKIEPLLEREAINVEYP